MSLIHCSLLLSSLATILCVSELWLLIKLTTTCDFEFTILFPELFISERGVLTGSHSVLAASRTWRHARSILKSSLHIFDWTYQFSKSFHESFQGVSYSVFRTDNSHFIFNILSTCVFSEVVMHYYCTAYKKPQHNLCFSDGGCIN